MMAKKMYKVVEEGFETEFADILFETEEEAEEYKYEKENSYDNFFETPFFYVEEATEEEIRAWEA